MAAYGWINSINGKIFSGVRIPSFLCVTAVLLLICMMIGGSYANPVSKRSVYQHNRVETCSPENAERSCIMGCFKCANTYGRKAYDMTMCCSECQRTKALLLDDGPEYCSARFFVKGTFNG